MTRDEALAAVEAARSKVEKQEQHAAGAGAALKEAEAVLAAVESQDTVVSAGVAEGSGES